MSIVPSSSLSSRDRRLLGNNLNRDPQRRRLMTQRKLTRAVNRSLQIVGESITRLHRRPSINCV